MDINMEPIMETVLQSTMKTTQEPLVSTKKPMDQYTATEDLLARIPTFLSWDVPLRTAILHRWIIKDVSESAYVTGGSENNATYDEFIRGYDEARTRITDFIDSFTARERVALAKAFVCIEVQK
jgi:hypothetical protein